MVRVPELEQYIQDSGDDEDAFVVDPRWQPSKFENGNVVFNSIHTIQPWYGGKYRFIIGGGEPHFDEEGYKTQELAKRALFQKLRDLFRDS